MRPSWLKQMNSGDDETSWTLPFGDLMSLLLAVFVMIAAMSELRSGPRFDEVNGGIRDAFGFEPLHTVKTGSSDVDRWMSFIGSLQGAGLKPAMSGPVGTADRELLEQCEVVTEGDRLVLRLTGPTLFESFSARLQPTGRQVVGRLADFLANGQTRVEVRGHNGDGPLPMEASFRDGLDLSYARARSVADVLAEAGVSSDRLSISALGDQDPIVASSQSMPHGANRRVEIIVHAASTASRVGLIAGKERSDNG